MADNKNKIDRMHQQMPKFFRTRQNKNWKTVIEAIGAADQDLSELLEGVREQLFVKTSSRPYIDRLASNVNVSRPRFVGMADEDFRGYIPVLAYQPKQVKLVIDSLLDIFFFRESTTAFQQSSGFAPFELRDSWKLSYLIDGDNNEEIEFSESDFEDIYNATATEVVGVINRQAENSFAVVFNDRITKRDYIRIFSNTIGSKGSVTITGGRSNKRFKFVGYNDVAGSQADTVWEVTKIGNEMKFTYVSGLSPNLQTVSPGDVAIIDLNGNSGSFVISDVNISDGFFTFDNVFGTEGTYNSIDNPDYFVNFFTKEKIVIWKANNRAITWETKSGEIVVEMPATPPVVKRSLIGSAHMNGETAVISEIVDQNTIILNNTDGWPETGSQFVLQEINDLQQLITTDEGAVVDTLTSNTLSLIHI